MIKGCSYLKSAPLQRSKEKGLFFLRKITARELKTYSVTASRKNFVIIYVACRDVFLHNNLITERLSAAEIALLYVLFTLNLP